MRPHTIRGTVLGSISVTARALIENSAAVDWGLLPRASLGVAALLCGNGYIVGINQIYDVDIDQVVIPFALSGSTDSRLLQVNKPFLPIASREMPVVVAWALVLSLAATGIAVATYFFGKFIGALYSFGLFLGTVYSIPPFRLKQFAIPAFLIIATVRGFLLNFGVYYATRSALSLPFKWSPAIR